jgi:glycine/D-amino acid oxidase-like deaminating enzyme
MTHSLGEDTAAREAGAPACVYSMTARPLDPLPELQTEVRTRVAVIGGGYTGLSAALRLAEKAVPTVLLEAREPGWGAAGRNGGQVNAGLKHEPDDIERDLGPVFGPRLLALAGDAPAYLFGLINRFKIDCEARREGTVRAAYRRRDVIALDASLTQWRSRGVQLQSWDQSKVMSSTGTDRYLAAIFDVRGGTVNPLRLARGLAAAVVSQGAQIYRNSAARSLERTGSGWRINTIRGSVLADEVIIATDGYTDNLWPGLRTSIIPIYSAITASEPLPAAVAASVMPGGGGLYESGDVTVYYRRDQAGRLLIGGRGPQRPLTGQTDVRHLVRYAQRLWPALTESKWTHRWNGQFALTADLYPHFHRPAPNIFIGLGYSGRGVALGTAMGAELAAAACGTDPETLSVPTTTIQGIPFHSWWKLGVNARVAYSRLKGHIS